VTPRTGSSRQNLVQTDRTPTKHFPTGLGTGQAFLFHAAVSQDSQILPGSVPGLGAVTQAHVSSHVHEKSPQQQQAASPLTSKIVTATQSLQQRILNLTNIKEKL